MSFLTVMLSDLLQATSFECIVAAEQMEQTIIKNIAVDSRLVTEQSLFVAIKGNAVDGHNFIEKAISQGAAAIIVEDTTRDYSQCNIPVIAVENTRSTAAKLAYILAGRPANKMKIVGVTGTNGKTTVATIIYNLLLDNGFKPGLLGTAGKRIGEQFIPSALTTSDPIELAKDLASMKQAGCNVVVMEVSSHALDQERVAALDFDVAVFTNLSRDHLDYHGDMEHYASSKGLLFKHLSPNAVAVYNADDSYAQAIVGDTAAHKVGFSFNENGSVDAQCELMNANGMDINIEGFGIHTALIGEFNAQNVVAAFLAVRALGVSSMDIKNSFEQVKGAAGRLEKVTLDGFECPTILVDYAHTPDALENVGKALKAVMTPKQRLFTIFGCGGDRDRGKRPLMAKAAADFADEAILTSDNPRTEEPKQIFEDTLKGFENDSYTVIEDRREAIQFAITKAQPSDVVLIAGKGHEDYQIIGTEKIHFDDREEALTALRNKFSSTTQQEAR